MKVLLINPPFTHYGGLEGHGGKATPLNLGYLASYLRERGKGYEVSILDAEALDMLFEDIEYEIKKQIPSVVGITSSTPAYTNAIKIAEICKKVNPKIFVVIGGVHASAFPQRTLTEGFDYVVIGEGEETFFDLLETIRNNKPIFNVNGICYKDGKEAVLTKPRRLIENLDVLPFPARDLMPHHLYQPPPTKRVSTFNATSITSARGCPFSCNFCSAHVVWTRRYRHRSAVNVADEFEYCINTFNMREFIFTDELFTLKLDRASAICEEIINRNLKIAWVCMCRVGQVTEGILKLMKKAGCKEISFGIESGDERILDTMHKGITLDKARESIRLTKKVGIHTHASYMIGNLGETEESIRNTINFAKELNTDIAAFFVATPLPGTELYEKALAMGYIRKETEWKDFSPLSKTNPVINFPHLPSSLLMQWHRRAIKEYYMRPKYILKKIFSLRSKADILNIYNGLKFFKSLN